MTPYLHAPIEMLNEQQLARLFARLEVPLAVQSILDGMIPYDDDSHLALQDMIGGQTPDQALLSIALSALVLESRIRQQGDVSGEILAVSAEMMVQDYAVLYLEQIEKYPKGTLFDRSDLEFLSTIPEDLENLSDLLAVLGDVLPDHEKLFRRLAMTLSQQAQAQALIAETLVESYDEPLAEQDKVCYAPAAEINAVALGDNVIPFRRR